VSQGVCLEMAMACPNFRSQHGNQRFARVTFMLRLLYFPFNRAKVRSVTVLKMLLIPLSHYHTGHSLTATRRHHFSYHTARICYCHHRHTLKIIEEVQKLSLSFSSADCHCQCQCRLSLSLSGVDCHCHVPFVSFRVLFAQLTFCRI
jgi:hypothetical protein